MYVIIDIPNWHVLIAIDIPTIIDVFACKSFKNYILQAIEDLLQFTFVYVFVLCFVVFVSVCERCIQGCIIAFVIDDNGVIFVLLLSLFFLGVFIYLL